MIDTMIGEPIPDEMLCNYFKFLVNRFFKILPMRENGEATLPTYTKSLQAEILGCKNFITCLNNDPNIVTLLAILQFLLDNPECPVDAVKREVFGAISICNKLKSKYTKAV